MRRRSLVADFRNAVKAELASVHGEHVKTIDALMLRIPDPGTGSSSAFALPMT